MLVEVKNEKENEWKWAGGTGHQEDTHGWLPFITAKSKSTGTLDMMMNLQMVPTHEKQPGCT